MPPDSVKYFRYERGYDMPPTMIDKKEYENATRGCSKGISQCDNEYKKLLKYTRNQYKNGNPQYTDSNGKMIRPSPCRICALARDFSKTCDIQYENQFYGYAKEAESGKNIYFHWSNNWHPNCGTSKSIKEGRLVSKGIPDKKAYDDLFRLSVKPDNQKVKTPKQEEFISGYIHENKSGPYKGRLQWTKWFRHSLTFVNWTKLTRSAIENKGMQNLVNQPKLLIARMIYDQNKLIPEMENGPKTPCNCEPISHEHWILAAITMVAFLGIRPKKRNILDQYGGISKVGELDYFTFLEHIDDPDELIRITALPRGEDPVVPLRMHPVDFSQKIHGEEFWSIVSNTFKNTPFIKKVDKPLGWKKRQIDYGYYVDNQSIEHLPYHNPAPYYNSAHGYDPSRYLIPQHYEHGYDFRQFYHVPMVAMPQMIPLQQVPLQYGPVHEGSTSGTKRSTSSKSDSDYSMLDQGLEDLRNANRKMPRMSAPSPRRSRSSRYSARELRNMIIKDVRKEKQRKNRRYESSESSSDDEKCREDSDREDDRRKSPSIQSTNSSFEAPQHRYPTYDELVEQIKQMEQEKEDMQISQAVERRSSEKSKRKRWKTDSSDSDEF